VKTIVILIFIELLSPLAYGDTCPALHHWVSPHPRSEYYRYDGTFVASSFVKGHCRANQKSFELWGKNFYDDSLPQGWPHKENIKKWNESEKESVLETVDRLPKFLVSLNRVRLYRSGKSVTKNNHGTSAENVIFLYDSAFKNEKLLFKVLAHELSHQLYARSTQIERIAINTALGWVQINGVWNKTSEAELLLDDSFISVEEAYANAIELFIAEPARLKSRHQKIYNWLTLEYGDKIKW
jgi:hypothetical protein